MTLPTLNEMSETAAKIRKLAYCAAHTVATGNGLDAENADLAARMAAKDAEDQFLATMDRIFKNAR